MTYLLTVSSTGWTFGLGVCHAFPAPAQSLAFGGAQRSAKGVALTKKGMGTPGTDHGLDFSKENL